LACLDFIALLGVLCLELRKGSLEPHHLCLVNSLPQLRTPK
jgi:hypothetical protein